jgi:mannose-1-phosphate guanylyltransferase
MVKQYKYSSKQTIDYAVITRRGKILYNPNHSRWAKAGNFSMKEAYDNPHPDWALAVDGRPENFIKVVKMAK